MILFSNHYLKSEMVRRVDVSIFNRYQNYEQETDQDVYEYKKCCYEREEAYRERIRRELERDYFGNSSY